MKLSNALFLLFLFLFYCRETNVDNLLLAKVGNRAITVAEFSDRAQFNPVISTLSVDAYKENLLNALVAEILISRMVPIDLPEYMPLVINRKKREAVIEKLWDDIIFKEITISDSSLWVFYLNTKKTRAIEFSVFKDSLHADNFRLEWAKNNPQTLQLLQKDTLAFTGEIAVLEKKVFLAPPDIISQPLKLGTKYLVFKVLEEWQTALADKQEFDQKYTSLKKSYLKTLKQEYFQRYVKNTFQKENYQLNRDLFKKLTEYLEDKLLQKPDVQGINSELIHFSGMDGLDPQRTLISFDRGADWTIKEFLQQLAVAPYPLSYDSKGAFRFSIIKAAKRILDDELLYRQGLDHNLDESDYVNWQTDMWKDFYISQSLVAQKKYTSQRWSQVLDSLKNDTHITVRWDILDTLSIRPAKMMVLKTHFPGQTIVPGQNKFDFKLERDNIR